MPAQGKTKKSSNKYAPTTWGGELLEDVVVPSGQTCQCRRPGMQGLIANGILDKMDTLTAVVNDKHISRVKKGGVKVDDITSDPAKLIDVLNTVDKVVAYVVVQPDIHRPVVIDDDGNERDMEDDERETGVVYTDFIDIEDKMFLFNYAVGGTRDVERFRRESGLAVAGVGPEQDVEVQTE